MHDREVVFNALDDYAVKKHQRRGKSYFLKDSVERAAISSHTTQPESQAESIKIATDMAVAQKTN